MSYRNVTPNTATSSQDRLTEIRARLDAATPGPWERHPSEPWIYVRRGPFTVNIIGTQLRAAQQHGDADLIAHAPADIAWLLAEVERLEKRVAMYEVVKS